MRRVMLASLVLSIFVGTEQVSAQTTFEVASIKPSDLSGNYVEVTPGAVNVHSATLMTCITWAYSVERSQVIAGDSGASWLLDSQRYDIIAKSAGSVPIEQLKLMLQTLLADRFKMAMHRQRRDLQAYALVVEQGGPKIRVSSGEGGSERRMTSKITRQWIRMPMARFAEELSEAMQAPVQDETGLLSRYDFALDLTPYLPENGERPDIAAMMVTAIKEQLGLRLISRRALVEVVVIDHIEKPSAN